MHMPKTPINYFSGDPWTIVEEGFDPAYQRVSESIFSVANEFMGVRGYFEEGYSGDHLLGSYFNHLYEMMDIHHDQVFKGFVTQGAAMINAVDWLYTRLWVDGEQLDLAKCSYSDFTRKLDMHRGVLERAVALARRHEGDNSLALAIILINYGQVKADGELDAGLEMIKTARDIFERHHDRRAVSATGALLVISDHHDRFADALRYGEQALAGCDADTSSSQRAVIEWGLARALGATGGDRVRARGLARDARGRFFQLGAGYASYVAELDRWLAAH